MMMTQVWMLSRGEYSDYEVLGVFSTPEKAKAALPATPPAEWARYVERRYPDGVNPVERVTDCWTINWRDPSKGFIQPINVDELQTHVR